MRISLAFGAWLDHEPVWLPPEEADAVLAGLRDEPPWEQREIVLFGRRILQPRLIAWAGDVGYRYSGQTLADEKLRRSKACFVSRHRPGVLGMRPLG